MRGGEGQGGREEELGGAAQGHRGRRGGRQEGQGCIRGWEGQRSQGDVREGCNADLATDRWQDPQVRHHEKGEQKLDCGRF